MTTSAPYRAAGRKVPSPHGKTIPSLVRYFPIIFFQCFMTFTLIIFAFGPWDWPIANPIQLYSFVIINQLALLFGYLLAVSRAKPARFHFPLPINSMVGLCATAVLSVLPLLTYHRAGGSIDFVRAILAPGDAYKATREAALLAPYSVVGYVGLVLSPLIWPLLGLTVTFWKRLSFPVRVAAVAGILTTSLSFLLIGTNKGNVDIISLMPWFLLLGSDSPEKILTSQKLRNFCLMLLVASIVFIPYFGNNIMTRSAGLGGPSMSTGQGDIHSRPIRLPGIEGHLADVYEYGFQSLAAYIGQGYYGLSLSLEEPFVWTYGVGHSRIFTWLAERFTFQERDAIYDRTYPVRTQHDFGWDADRQWITLYPWLASDVSFFGVPLVMFFIGRLFALTWIDSIGGNPTAVVVFGLLLVTLYYVSGNAQVYQDADAVCVFWVYLMWWLTSRRPGMDYRIEPNIRSGQLLKRA